MVKFIKLKNVSVHEYLNVSSVVGVTKGLYGFFNQTILRYETTKSQQYTITAFPDKLIGDYIIEAVMNANSSSHTSNVYYPEITQGTQPTIGSIT